MNKLNEITRKADVTARIGVHAALIAGLQQHANAAQSIDALYWQSVCELRLGFRPVLMRPALMATLRSLALAMPTLCPI